MSKYVSLFYCKWYKTSLNYKGGDTLSQQERKCFTLSFWHFFWIVGFVHMKGLSCLLILVIDVFQAVNQLCSHFEAYRDVPKITELREKFKNIKQILKSHVFSDFSRYVILFDQKIKFIVTQVFIFGKITLYLVWNNVMFMPLIMSCGPNVLLWPSISLQCM